jgi:hypothetical protein
MKTTQVPSWIKFTMAGTGNDCIASLFVTSIIDEPAITAVAKYTINIIAAIQCLR